MNNKRYIKRFIAFINIFLIFTILSALLISCESAEIYVPTPKQDVYIYDEANNIDDNLEYGLNKLLVNLEKETEIEFVVISIKSLEHYDIEEYSNKVFNTLGIGKKGKDNGILLLFSQSDSRVRLEIGRGLEEFLTDAKCGKILDKYFVPYRDNDDYNSATDKTVRAVITVIGDEYQIELTGMDRALLNDSDSQYDDVTTFLLGIIIIIILITIVFYAIEDGYSGGSSGGYYGGGFGGGSSGGGFGGGFSGGGGASR